MKLQHLQKTFYDTFMFINLYDDIFIKKYLKKHNLGVNKENKKHLKNIYKNFNISKKLSFEDFNDICVKNTILFKEDIFLTAINIAEKLNHNKVKETI